MNFLKHHEEARMDFMSLSVNNLLTSISSQENTLIKNAWVKVKSLFYYLKLIVIFLRIHSDRRYRYLGNRTRTHNNVSFFDILLSRKAAENFTFLITH